MDLVIPPLKHKNLTESNPLKSRFLVCVLAVSWVQRFGGFPLSGANSSLENKTVLGSNPRISPTPPKKNIHDYTMCIYIYIYICIIQTYIYVQNISYPGHPESSRPGVQRAGGIDTIRTKTYMIRRVRFPT